MVRNIKKVAVAGLMILTVVITACGTKGENKIQEDKSAKKIQKLNVDMEMERKSQDAVDKGYQAWKKNAMDVAEECLINTGIGARKGECKVLSDDGVNALVFVNTKDGNFKVTLKRLVRADGIWTATEVEKE